MSQAPRSGTAQAALLCQQSTWEPDAGHEETGVGQHSTRRLHCHTLSELRRFPSQPYLAMRKLRYYVNGDLSCA